jgi:hypothetical protein
MTSVIQRPDGTHMFRLADASPLGHEVVAAAATGTYQDVQEKIGELTAAIHDLNLNPDEAAMRDAINDEYAKDGVPGLQIGKYVLSWLQVADEQEIVDFCRANSTDHAERLQRLRDAEPELRADVSARVGRLQNLGYLSLAGATAYEKALHGVGPLQVMDFFEAGGMRASAYYSPGTAEIVHRQLVHPTTHRPTPQLLTDNFHEFTHAAGDKSSGFMQWNTSRGKGHRWLEEAFTAHTSEVSEPGATQLYLLDPAQRQGGYQKVYVPEREFLHGLTAEQAPYLELGDIAEAYYAPPGKAAAVRKQVFAKLDRTIRRWLPQAYKEGGLRAFSHDYGVSYAAKQSTRWLQVRLNMLWTNMGITVMDLTQDDPAGSVDLQVEFIKLGPASKL